MPSALIGKILLNQYRVEKYIALTPLGELYRATDTRNNKALAFTLLPKSISENIDALKELESTSSKLRNIYNSNIVPYFGLFQTPTLAFLLEEWIDGPSLRNILEKSPISVNEALIYIKAVSSALEALHRQNFLHLNLAPEFIHINKAGEIVLGGIAGSRPFGEKIFKRHNKYPNLYLAPEQFLAETFSPATDIYSLSVLLYQLVTGAWINGKVAPKTNDAIRRAHLGLIPPSPMSLQKEIPDHFSRMLLWALRKKPEDRLKTTTELLSSLSLAVKFSVDEIPLRADLKTAPMTNGILRDWDFLPPLKPNIILQDTAPLEDRLAVISIPQAKKPGSRIKPLPIMIFAVLAGFISLFWFVRTAPATIATPIQFTPFASDYTPPPTVTPLPRPTEEHGGRITFTCTRGDFNQLCMVNRDGTGFAQLTDMEASNYYPTFTPDGSSLLFASNRNGSFDLYLLLFSEKQLFQLTQDVGNVISPDYSPDGHTIVFANRPGDGYTSIWMVNSDGLNPHLVYTGTNDIVTTAWSPNGKKIAYAMSVGIPQEYEIYTMDANGKNHLRISQGLKGIGGSIDWSPDSNYLLVYAGPYEDKDVFRIDAANGKFSQLTSGGNNAGAAYSPDGKYIVFNSMRNNDQADLYIMRADGTNQQQLTNNPEPDWGPQWAP
jgi:TolB protein